MGRRQLHAPRRPQAKEADGWAPLGGALTSSWLTAHSESVSRGSLCAGHAEPEVGPMTQIPHQATGVERTMRNAQSTAAMIRVMSVLPQNHPFTR